MVDFSNCYQKVLKSVKQNDIICVSERIWLF